MAPRHLHSQDPFFGLWKRQSGGDEDFMTLYDWNGSLEDMKAFLGGRGSLPFHLMVLRRYIFFPSEALALGTLIRRMFCARCVCLWCEGALSGNPFLWEDLFPPGDQTASYTARFPSLLFKDLVRAASMPSGIWYVRFSHKETCEYGYCPPPTGAHKTWGRLSARYMSLSVCIVYADELSRQLIPQRRSLACGYRSAGPIKITLGRGQWT